MLRTTALAVLCLIAAVPSFATTYRWNGSASELWSNPANWTPNGVPQSGDALTFGTSDCVTQLALLKETTTPVTVNDLAPGLTFGLSSSTPYEIRGNEIVATGIVNNTRGAVSYCVMGSMSVYAPLRLSGNASYDLANVGPIDIGPYRLDLGLVSGIVEGPLAGTGQLVLGSTSCATSSFGCSATLRGTNTFTGVVRATTGFGGQSVFSLASDGATLPASSITVRDLTGSGTFGPVTVSRSLGGAFNTGSLKVGPGATFYARSQRLVRVTGSVDIDQAVLQMSDDFVAEQGQVFTLIDNDGTDPVIGTFKGLPEGAILEQGARRFVVSYVGGDGNDVTLTVVRAAKQWQGGGGNNLWSNAANWVEGVAPVNGDSVQFPFFVEVVNDIAGLVLEALYAPGPTSCTTSITNYSISGEPFGITAQMGSAIIRTRVRAMADGAVLSGNFYGGIDAGSHSIEVQGPVVAATADQGITGTGTIAYRSSGCVTDIDGLHSFSGTVTLTSTGTKTRFNGEMPANFQVPGSSLSAGGAIGNVSLSGSGSLTPSPFLDTRDLTLGAGTSLVLSPVDDVLGVTGTVTLSSPSLVIPQSPYVVGRTYVPLRNDGTDPITGTFAGVPEGGVVKTSKNFDVRVSYVGGDGNDLALTPLAGPAMRNDFDRDGKADILWYNAAFGLVRRTSMDGLAITSSETVYSEPNLAWKIIGEGDFDANGVSDLVWRNASTDEVYVQLFGPDGRPMGGGVTSVKRDASWRLASTVDFDGDGRADLIWLGESGTAEGKLQVNLMDGASIRSQPGFFGTPILITFDGSVKGLGRLVAAGRFGPPNVSPDLTLVFREEAGAGRVWFVDVFACCGFNQRLVYQEPDQDWRIVAAPDLNGDGVLDLLWQNGTTGEIYGMVTAYSSGNYSPSAGYIHLPDTAAWVVADTGDYDGDGKDDILWYNEVDGRVHVMLMDGLEIRDQRTIYSEPDTRWMPMGPRFFSAPPSGTLAKALDMDGDGRSDVVYRNASTGQVYRLLADGLTLSSGAEVYAEPDTAWEIVGDGDFDGDGHADLLYRNMTTGDIAMVRFGSGGTVIGSEIFYSEPTPNWRIALVSDIDGDGRSDIVWRHSATGQVYVMLMQGSTIKAQGMVYQEPDTNWNIVAAGDFTGSAMKNGLVWRNQATGQVYLQTVAYAGGDFSVSGDLIYTEPNLQWRILAAADFDGDGKADLLWRNVGTGQVWMMTMDGDTITSQGEVYTEPSSDWQIIAQGDYDGDGKADLLWWNSSTGLAYMMLMDGRTITSQGAVYSEPNTMWEIIGPGNYDTP